MMAFLIDADNLSSPGWVEEACKRLEAEEGTLAIRRAYGSPENLRGLAEVLRRWSIRPYPNLSLSKNTTDIALAVDAMELVCRTPAPTVMAIGSGDADFVPLVVRLREHGVRLVCVSERSKMTQDAEIAFDKVLLVGEGSDVGVAVRASQSVGAVAVDESRASAGAGAAAVTPLATQVPATAKAPAKKAAAKKAAPMSGSPKAAGAKSVAAQATGISANATVKRILEVAPSLVAGEWQPLSDIARLLHDHKVLAKSAKSTTLLGKFPHHFELLPAKQPNRVRFIPVKVG